MFGRKYLSDTPNRWIEFHNGFEIGATLDKYSYFDERPLIGITITQILSIFLVFVSPYFIPFIFGGWGKLYMKLPIKTGHQEAESPCWGYRFSSEGIFRIYIGGNSYGRKSISIKMPWFLEWYRTSILMSDGSWVHETESNRKDLWNSDWQDRRWKMEVYLIKNTKIMGIATVTEREWRRRWLFNFPIFNLVFRRIEIDYSNKQDSMGLKGSYVIGKSEDYFGELEKFGFTSKDIIRSKKINQILGS